MPSTIRCSRCRTARCPWPEQAIGLRVAALVRDGGTLQIGIGSMGDAVADALALRRRDNPRFRSLLDALGVAGGERDDLPAGLYGMSEMFIEGFLHLRRHGVLRRTVGRRGVSSTAASFLGSAGFYRQLHELGETDRQGHPHVADQLHQLAAGGIPASSPTAATPGSSTRP